MTDKITLFRCGSAAVYDDDGWYRDTTGMSFYVVKLPISGHLLRFKPDSDIGIVDGEPFDLLLQCLEHRLATRNLADPMFERTNALECLRKMRGWLADIAKIEQEAS